MPDLYKLKVYWTEPHRGPRGERCFIIEDDAGHQLMLLQPLDEMGDGDDFERHARAMVAAPELVAAAEASQEIITRVSIGKRSDAQHPAHKALHLIRVAFAKIAR